MPPKSRRVKNSLVILKSVITDLKKGNVKKSRNGKTLVDRKGKIVAKLSSKKKGEIVYEIPTKPSSNGTNVMLALGDSVDNSGPTPHIPLCCVAWSSRCHFDNNGNLICVKICDAFAACP